MVANDALVLPPDEGGHLSPRSPQLCLGSGLPSSLDVGKSVIRLCPFDGVAGGGRNEEEEQRSMAEGVDSSQEVCASRAAAMF